MRNYRGETENGRAWKPRYHQALNAAKRNAGGVNNQE
jgi:hypothetical protein